MMNISLKNFFSSLVFVALCCGGLSSIQAAKEPAHTRVQFLAEKSYFTPGETIWVGFHLKMDPGWHTYWKNPGDSGMPTSVKWELPKGFTAGAIEWPRPEKIEISGLISYAYENEVFLMVPISVDNGVSNQSVVLKGRLTWLECKEICLPGGANFEMKLFNSAANTIVDKSINPLFEYTRQRLPKNLSDEEIIRQISSEKKANRDGLTLWKALLFSFLGGLILNLMPCVLPVLSIKILSFVKQSQDSTASRVKQGLLFTLGVLVSFWILAGFVIFVQLGGHRLGWGFQLQSPWFVGAMAVLFLILGLNMWGVFEIGTSMTRFGGALRQTKGSQYSFLSGVLATIVATPCTAPFMGSAMGFALSQSAAVAFLIFTSVGLGMSTPYLFLTAFPTFLKFVPKPGPWMDVLKKGMAILLFATTVWLGWVLWVQLKSNTSFEHAGLSTEPFSAARVEELRQQGTPVFIDFTAAWCLTCQVNRKVVFEKEAVLQKFKDKGVVFMIADWTNRDDAITQALNKYERNGVPAYVLYGKNSTEMYRLLPEVLTPQIMLDALDQI